MIHIKAKIIKIQMRQAHHQIMRWYLPKLELNKPQQITNKFVITAYVKVAIALTQEEILMSNQFLMSLRLMEKIILKSLKPI